jgi:hypothetical protein
MGVDYNDIGVPVVMGIHYCYGVYLLLWVYTIAMGVPVAMGVHQCRSVVANLGEGAKCNCLGLIT